MSDTQTESSVTATPVIRTIRHLLLFEFRAVEKSSRPTAPGPVLSISACVAFGRVIIWTTFSLLPALHSISKRQVRDTSLYELLMLLKLGKSLELSQKLRCHEQHIAKVGDDACIRTLWHYFQGILLGAQRCFSWMAGGQASQISRY